MKITGHFSTTINNLQLWADHDRIDFKLNPHFPINTLKLMRGAIAAETRHELEVYSNAVFDAMWQDGRNLGDADEVHDVLLSAGLDADAYAAAIEEDGIKAVLVANTDAAVAAGLFGAPSFIVGSRLFFGQDRMDFVEAELMKAV